MTCRPLYVVVRTDGRIYFGYSSLFGRGIWLGNIGDDPSLWPSEGLKFKRDGRWLAQAEKYSEGQSVSWKEV